MSVVRPPALSFIMRTLLYGLLSVVASGADAQTIVTSVADGAWNSASTWDCGCVPAADNTVVVGHAVTLTQNASLTVGLLVVQADGSLTSVGNTGLTHAGEFFNYGLIDLYDLLLAPNIITPDAANFGTLTVAHRFVQSREDFVNTGTILVTDTLSSGAGWTNAPTGMVTAAVMDGVGPFHNQGLLSGDGHFRVPFVNDSAMVRSGMFTVMGYSISHGAIDHTGTFTVTGSFQMPDSASLQVQGMLAVLLGASFSTAANVEVNGDLQLAGVMVLLSDTLLVTLNGDLLVDGILSGAGVLCVTDSTVNHGLITGAIDLCDITRTALDPPFLDLNDGLVDTTVTFCNNPYCMVDGIPDMGAHRSPVVYPVPTDGFCLIAPLPVNGRLELQVTDMLGRAIPVDRVRRGDAVEVDLRGAPNGPLCIRWSVGPARGIVRTIVSHTGSK